MPDPLYEVSSAGGGLIAASVTATTAATAIPLLTLTRNTREIKVGANLNNPVQLTIDGVDEAFLPANMSVVLAPPGQFYAAGAVLGVYYTDSAPSSGRIKATAT